MKNSRRWNVTSYIKDFSTIKLQVNWKNGEIHTRAIFSTLVTLKSYSRVNISFLNKLEKNSNSYSYVFRLLALKYLFCAKKRLFTSDILLNRNINTNNVHNFVLNESIELLLKDIKLNYNDDQRKNAEKLIIDMMPGIKIYCFEFLYFIEKDNLVDVLLEELYLLEEIELFKNRGIENDGHNSSS